jgi:hypothetical protein
VKTIIATRHADIRKKNRFVYQAVTSRRRRRRMNNNNNNNNNN